MEMTAAALIDRLAGLKTMGTAPREELEWLASHGTVRHLQANEILSAKGQRVEAMFVLLSGHVAISVDRGAGRHRILEWREGDATGMLPYSRLVSPPGDTVAFEATTILAIPRDDLREMIVQCPEVTTTVVHMLRR